MDNENNHQLQLYYKDKMLIHANQRKQISLHH